MTDSATKDWVRNRPDHLCKICGHDGYCSESDDGSLAGCMRVQVGSFKTIQQSNGASCYLHRLNGSHEQSNIDLPITGPKDRADADTLHAVYSALLAECTLSTHPHGIDLIGRRKLSADVVRANGYRSVCSTGRRQVAEKLIERFRTKVWGVPGFVRVDYQGNSYPTLALPKEAAGLFIPVRDLQKRIVALRLRKDNGEPRYVWLTSKATKRAYKGPGPGTPVHVPLSAPATAPVVRVTEGELKADVATALNSSVPTISIAGVNCWAPALAVLKEMEAQTVRLAFDADAGSKIEVAKALKAFAAALMKAGFAVELERWQIEAGKGIDDVLTNGTHVTEVITGADVLKAIEEICESAEREKPVADVNGHTATGPAAVAGEASVCNFTLGEKDENGQQLKIPINMGEIHVRIDRAADNWPKRIGPVLFVASGEKIDFLSTPAAMFAWLGRRCDTPPHFIAGANCHSRAEVFEERRRTAEDFKAVETVPHEPPMDGHYYACRAYNGPGDGLALNRFVDRFNFETPIDRDLFVALLLTCLWGGPGGSRPAFIITSGDGRGAGKTTIAKMVCRIFGGFIDISANEDAGKMKVRLLSGDGRKQRIALLDNVKTLRFSWAELESTITTSTISGHMLYVGEASRPNTLVWILTLNGPSLSTDIAQRCVFISVSRPAYVGLWEEETNALIDAERDLIIADLLAMLRNERGTLQRFTRWGTWERDILSRLPEPGEAQKVILERQQVSDVEQEESEIIEDVFRGELETLHYSPERQRIFIPSVIAAEWFNKATNEHKATSGASRMIRQMITEGRLSRLTESTHNGYGRGFVWVGDEWTLSNDDSKQYLDIETRRTTNPSRFNTFS